MFCFDILYFVLYSVLHSLGSMFLFILIEVALTQSA